ncbi:S-adenosyl-L-methionine-dependent methyltransferase [Trichoderma afarasin]
MPAATDDYVLGRDLHGSIRLEAQHLLFKMHNGYALNPKIPISSDMKIAEIGTGTGIWLQDIASQLPETVQLHGYDVSANQFPPASLCPPNLTFATLDAFGDVPAHLVETYDVVHLRFWCAIIRGNDPGALICHAIRLLKPGGYLQWEDADMGKPTMRGDEAEAFHKLGMSVLRTFNVLLDWIGDIPKLVADHGLTVVDSATRPFDSTLVPLTIRTYLAGWAELFQLVGKTKDPSLPTASECQRVLLELDAGVKHGALYYWLPVNLLAQKPSTE